MPAEAPSESSDHSKWVPRRHTRQNSMNPRSQRERRLDGERNSEPPLEIHATGLQNHKASETPQAVSETSISEADHPPRSRRPAFPDRSIIEARAQRLYEARLEEKYGHIWLFKAMDRVLICRARRHAIDRTSNHCFQVWLQAALNGKYQDMGLFISR